MAAAREMMRETDDDMRRIAERLESDNPLWMVVYGVYTRQFVAFPRFAAPKGTFIAAHYPGAVPARMRQIERETGISRLGVPPRQADYGTQDN